MAKRGNPTDKNREYAQKVLSRERKDVAARGLLGGVAGLAGSGMASGLESASHYVPLAGRAVSGAGAVGIGAGLGASAANVVGSAMASRRLNKAEDDITEAKGKIDKAKAKNATRRK